MSSRLSARFHLLFHRLTHEDRGDVPGWVLVTLMTAGLVTVLWVLARDRLTAVFDRAISSVAGS